MKFISFDIETNGYEYIDPRFRVTMVCTDDGEHVRVWGKNHIQEAVQALLDYNQSGSLVGHNGSGYDRPALKITTGHNLKCHDTQLMAFLLDEEHKPGKYKLESLAVSRLGVPTWKDAVTWDWKDTDNWTDDDERWAIMRQYCARDTRYTRLLAESMEPELRAQGLWTLYERTMLPASRALANIYERGIGVDFDNVTEARVYFDKQMADTGAILTTTLGCKKPGSSNALKKYLFEECGIDPIFWTDGGDPSNPNSKGPQPKLDKLALMTYKAMDPEGAHVPVLEAKLLYSEAQKMNGTYLKNYVKFAESNHDRRLHPSYGLTNTTSGRTSAFDPNIQNVPRLKMLRRCVGKPRPGYVYLQADLSQLELRMIADVFGEENMIAAFKRGDDLHRLMACNMTGKKPDEILKDERTTAKIANFLLGYGAEVQTFIDSAFVQYGLVFTREEATRIRNAFHASWPGLIPAYSRVYQELTKNEYVTTITGMRRRFRGFNDWSEGQKVASLREAINNTIQSPSSHLALTMLVQLEGMGFFNTAYIHDAVQMEILDDPVVIAKAVKDIKHAIEVTVPRIFEKTFNYKFLVPITCDVEVGPNWGELEKYVPS
jgi:DNA polymerase-1